MGARGQGIVLIGLRRSGKTTVGRRLAANLRVPFADLDALVEADLGMPVPEILVKRGEEEFRRAEVAALGRVVRGKAAVLAAGGGTAESASNRELMDRWGTVIYLDVPVAELLFRFRRDPAPEGRPLLRGRDVRDEITILHAHRDPIYRAAADFVVDATGTPGEVCARCVAALGTLPT